MFDLLKAMKRSLPVPFESLPSIIRVKLVLNWMFYVAMRVFLRAIVGKSLRDRIFSRMKRWDTFIINSWAGKFFHPKFGVYTYCDNSDDFIIFNFCPDIDPVKSVFKPSYGQVVIDVGAHVGRWTLYAAKLIGPTGKVIAIEPHPLNFAKLQQNVKLNGIENVTMIRAAVGKDDGETFLYESKGSALHSISNIPPQSTGRKIKVSLTKLDSLVKKLRLEKVKWLKINVEGAEADVLLGAKEVLQRYKPRIIIHVHGKENEGKIQYLLQKFNYASRAICRTLSSPYWGECPWVCYEPTIKS